jgi:hypothetical protein
MEADTLPEEEGIIARAIRHIFNRIACNPKDATTVRLSFLEIYNEEVRDLLHPEIDPKVKS